MRFCYRNRALAVLAFSALLLSAAPRSSFAAGENSVLLALGDSFAYGFTTDAEAMAIGPTNGDQGYVKPFADFLATTNGGIRPSLTNLAIPGESSTSFLTGLSAVAYPDVYPYTSALQEAPRRFPLLNVNYPPSAAPSYATTPQKDAALAAIAAAHGAGKSVDNIVLQVGGNDLLGLLLQPTFLGLPAQQQQDLFTAQFGVLQTDYINILGSVRAAAPEAQIFTLGYPNSFRQTPFGGITETLTVNANAIIQGVSQSIGANYVDIYTPFKDKELLLTHEGDGDFNPHPNEAGYAVIAGELRSARLAASAPEPTSVALCVLALPLAALRRRRA